MHKNDHYYDTHQCFSLSDVGFVFSPQFSPMKMLIAPHNARNFLLFSLKSLFSSRCHLQIVQGYAQNIFPFASALVFHIFCMLQHQTFHIKASPRCPGRVSLLKCVSHFMPLSYHWTCPHATFVLKAVD